MRYTKIRARNIPVSAELARAHLCIGDDMHDHALIDAKLEMAVGIAEDMTGRRIRDRYVEFDVLLGVAEDALRLPVHTAAIAEVSSPDGILTPEEDYLLLADDYDAHLLLIDAERFSGRKLHVKATEGYNAETIPPAIKAAILLLLGTLYDHESDNIVGRSVSELSLTAEKLLAPWRVTPYCDDHV